MEDKYLKETKISIRSSYELRPRSTQVEPGLDCLKTLWFQSIAGELSAYKLLHYSLYPGLYGYAHLLLDNKQVLDQMIQNLFIRIWQSPSKHEIIQIRVHFYKSLRSDIFEQKNLACSKMRFTEEVLQLNERVFNSWLNRLETAYLKYVACWEEPEIIELVGYHTDCDESILQYLKDILTDS